MNRWIGCAMLASLCCLVGACGKKDQGKDIMTTAPKKVEHKVTQKMDSYAHSQSVEWLGSTYTVMTNREPDMSLPLADDGYGGKYYDNTVKVRILRKDGTEFFSRTFKKSDFKAYVPDSFFKDGALTGIVFDKAEGDCLSFAASVGSPDKMSDEYVPLRLSVYRLGKVTISHDSDSEE